MEITQEKIEELVSTIRITLKPEDYKGQFDTVIKKYQKQANVPGFRPGKVPVGMIHKMYGKAILVDELNKLVSDKLENYLKEQPMQILGNPLPHQMEMLETDFNNLGDYTFSFDIGTAPEFELTIPPKHTFKNYEIKVDDAMVADHIKEIRGRYGKFETVEQATEHSIFYGTFTETDKDGQAKENASSAKSTLDISLIKDSGIKKTLMKATKGERVAFNLRKAVESENEMALILNVEKDKAKDLSDHVSLDIESITNRMPADLTQEFFNRLYGEGSVTDEEQFKARVHQELSDVYGVESDRKLQHDIEDELLNAVKLQLPDAFLKRWMKTVSEKPLEDDQIEKDYPSYSRGIKWRLIENKIFKDQDMKIETEEIQQFARHFVSDQFSRYGQFFSSDEQIEEFANRYLQNSDNVSRIIESITGRKVFEYLKENIKKNNQQVSRDEFIKIVQDHMHAHHH
ncbi:MAG TPA: trigger factor [Bacteroidia bacterium]|nr:trigger factor [Bacteroidia bacterium]